MTDRRRITRWFLRPGRWRVAALCSATVLIGSAACSEPAARPACDVALRVDGSLHGRIAPASGNAGNATSSAFRVRLVRDGRVVAETAADRRGAFHLRNLSGGLLQIVVDSPEAAAWQCFRLWPAAVAPPGALRDVTVVVDDRIVRAQGPIPPTGIPTAAVVTVIAAGAIAAPAIYANTKSEPHIPASP